MQRQWYFPHQSKVKAFWMCNADVARIGDLPGSQRNTLTLDNGFLLFGPCTSNRQQHFKDSFRNHKRAVSATNGQAPRRQPGDRSIAATAARRCLMHRMFGHGFSTLAIEVSSKAGK